VPAATNAFKDIDCLLAIGTRFSRDSYRQLCHPPAGDTDPPRHQPGGLQRQLPGQSYAGGDARNTVPALLEAVQKLRPEPAHSGIRGTIAIDKQAYYDQWRQHDSGDRP